MTADPSRALLLREEHPRPGRVVRLAGELTVGREGCDVVLPDPQVSRRHAVLRPRDGAVEVEDLGSTNGTWVNDAPARGAVLLGVGDVVRFGSTRWMVAGGP